MSRASQLGGISETSEDGKDQMFHLYLFKGWSNKPMCQGLHILFERQRWTERDLLFAHSISAMAGAEPAGAGARILV